MYFSKYVFSLPFWTFWVALGLGWAFAAALIIVLLPIWESRQGFVDLFKGIAAGGTIKEVVEAPVAEEKLGEMAEDSQKLEA